MDTHDKYPELFKCVICTERLSNTAEHRAAALTCGHVFGHSCIQQWFNGYENRGCPYCGQVKRSRDIIVLFIDSLAPGPRGPEWQQVVDKMETNIKSLTIDRQQLENVVKRREFLIENLVRHSDDVEMDLEEAEAKNIHLSELLRPNSQNPLNTH